MAKESIPLFEAFWIYFVWFEDIKEGYFLLALNNAILMFVFTSMFKRDAFFQFLLNRFYLSFLFKLLFTKDFKLFTALTFLIRYLCYRNNLLKLVLCFCFIDSIMSLPNVFGGYVPDSSDYSFIWNISSLNFYQKCSWWCIYDCELWSWDLSYILQVILLLVSHWASLYTKTNCFSQVSLSSVVSFLFPFCLFFAFVGKEKCFAYAGFFIFSTTFLEYRGILRKEIFYRP